MMIHIKTSFLIVSRACMFKERLYKYWSVQEILVLITSVSSQGPGKSVHMIARAFYAHIYKVWM